METRKEELKSKAPKQLQVCISTLETKDNHTDNNWVAIESSNSEDKLNYRK